jgi:hypothetical protein
MAFFAPPIGFIAPPSWPWPEQPDRERVTVDNKIVVRILVRLAH